MKFCEHCGHGLSDDAVFCSGCGKSCTQEAAPAPVFCEQCGAQLAPGQAFCESCGCPAAPAQPVQIPAQPVPNPGYVPVTPAPAKKKMPKWLLITLISVAAVALAVGIFALCGGFIHRAEIPTVLNENTVALFIDEVYKNSGNDYTIYATAFSYNYVCPEIKDPNSGNFIDVTFSKEDGRTCVSLYPKGAMPGTDDYSQYEVYWMGENYEYARDFIIALEKTLSGTSKAGDYLDDYQQMHAKAQRACLSNDDYYNLPLAQYTLGSGIVVEITYSHVFSDDWTIGYRLYIY